VRVVIETIPHKDQRYETCGDWFWTHGALRILVSETGNEDYNFLVAIHEMIEAYLCATSGISEESVTQFDMEFERQRKEGDVNEPGDSKEAPYHAQHRIASEVERYTAALMRIDWKDYEDTINRLGEGC